MNEWAKVKMFWQTMLGSTGSTLSATSTASGYHVNNIYSTFEVNSWKAANTTDPCDITLDLGGEEITNQDFEGGVTTGWSVAIQGAAVATFTASTTTPITGTYSGYLNITSGGGLSDIQIYATGINIVKGKVYRLTFRAKAAAARTIQVKVMQNVPPYGTLGLFETASLTTTASLITYCFTATASDSTARINFVCGADNNSVWLDDIFFSEVKSADYFAIIGHNLGTLGATILLQNSNDNSIWKTVAARKTTSDKVILEEARLVTNGDFSCWSGGLSGSVAPDAWTRGGAGSTAARSADEFEATSVGPYCLAFTRAGTDCYLYQRIADITYYRGKTLTLGCWVKSSVANQARISIWDGVSHSYSSYHSGNGNLQFLTVTKTFSASADSGNWIGLRVDTTDGTAYFGGVVMKEASSITSSDVSDCIQPLTDARRFWRIRLSNDDGSTFSSAPQMAIAIWGNKTELDYASASFDPYEQETKASVNMTQSGYCAGMHTFYTERKLSLSFEDADSTLYGKVKNWWDTHGIKPLFIAWETANSPDDVYLMWPEPRFSSPMTKGGAYRSINLRFSGRKA